MPGWTPEVTVNEASFPGAFSGMKAAAPPTVGNQLLIAVTGKVDSNMRSWAIDLPITDRQIAILANKSVASRATLQG